jgi:HAD superfamily hydrolase (TIGR01459 family)
MSLIAVKPPGYVEGLSAISGHFDHVLLDQWGVLHDGRRVYPGVPGALAGLRQAGKRILMLSNSGKRAAKNAERLAALGLPRNSFDFLVTSGEATWRALQRADGAPFGRLGRRCLLITRGGDRSVVEGIDLDLVERPRDADFILLAGLDDSFADPALWPAILDEAAHHGLPMICANPDLTMITPAGLAPAPGRMARVYGEKGGEVVHVGKPYAPIYGACLELLGNPDPARVLAVGDSLDHDILGGRRMGLPTVLVIGGVHAAAFAAASSPAETVRVAEMLAGETSPDWLLPALAW